VWGGNRLTGGAYDKGYFIEPTIFGDVTANMRIAQEEVFGPVLAVMIAIDFEEAMQLANATKFGLRRRSPREILLVFTSSSTGLKLG
jgi:acyl-CoA reductase-like NAD-dependent aldehyde dehydrogenase